MLGLGQSRVLDGEERTQALGVLPVVVLVAGTSAILVKFSSAPSPVKVSYRLAFATLGFLTFSGIYYRDHFADFDRRDLSLAAVSGVVLGLHYLLWFESLVWTTVAASTTLAQTQTIFVAILAYVALGETITRRTVFGICFAFAGAAVMSLGGIATDSLLNGVDPFLGNTLATAAGLLFAGYLVISRSVRQRIAVAPYMSVVHVFATATAFLLAVGTGESVSATSYPVHEWMLFFAMGLGPSFVAQTLSNWSLKYVASSVVSIAYLGVPITSSLLAFVLLSEVPGVGTVVGGVLTLSGIYVTVRQH
ncbi:DMT family transporter (plasmid) [Halobellus limi]|uniref:DMT family transporter n=1 Tax=Halobellus limi TaxID=699433 RepID=A0A1H6BPP1_9EURY|nr:DMT family transporter [Halobellus limi]SEG62663.1 Threonine/homoserine efflux transporter RhtA [Halobellus limi]